MSDPFAVLDVDGQAVTIGSSESDGLDLDDRRRLMTAVGVALPDEQDDPDN